MEQAKINTNNYSENLGFDNLNLIDEALMYINNFSDNGDTEKTLKKIEGKSNFFDAVSNPMQNFGSNTLDLTYMGLGETQKRNLSWRINQLDSMSRSVPYLDKASSWKATMALINGIDLNSKDPKVEDLTLVQYDLKRLFRPLHAVARWGDFYGGAGGLLIFDDVINEEDYMKPLVISQIKKGQFKGIKPLSRLYQIQPDLSSSDALVTHVSEDEGIYDASEIGQPKFFRINISGENEAQSKYFKVHRSRLLLYSSIELTWVEKRIELYFGPTLLERVYSDFARYESFIGQVTKLAQRSNVGVLNIGNLPQASLQGKRFAEFVTARLKALTFGVSSGNTVVLGDKDKEAFEWKSADFQNIPETLQMYMRNLSASLEAPSRVCFNDTDESDLKELRVKIRELQEGKILTWYHILIPILYRNRFGKALKDFTMTFKSLEMLTEKEKAEKLKMGVEMLSILWNDNAIDGESYHKMLIAMPSNITDTFDEITENYREHMRTQSEQGKPFNKMTADIQVAVALNHANEQANGSDGGNTKGSGNAKVEASLTGSSEGGDPKKTKDPIPRVSINKDKDK